MQSKDDVIASPAFLEHPNALNAAIVQSLEDAGEADRLFSILMGDNVEKRRNFINEHALEVQNLDV